MLAHNPGHKRACKCRSPVLGARPQKSIPYSIRPLYGLALNICHSEILQAAKLFPEMTFVD